MNTQPEVLIVLGIGKDKKPRAATFDAKDLPTVEAAAAHVGLKLAWAKTPEAQEIAKGLPEAKIFATTGRGLFPLVKPETYQQLLKLVTVTDPKPAAKPIAPAPRPSAGRSTDLWAVIKVGTTVLCEDDTALPDRAWWECVVTAVSKDATTLTLRWKNYPKLEHFKMKRKAVGLLPPKA